MEILHDNILFRLLHIFFHKYDIPVDFFFIILFLKLFLASFLSNKSLLKLYYTRKM